MVLRQPKKNVTRGINRESLPGLLLSSIVLMTVLAWAVLSHAANTAEWVFVSNMGGIKDAENHVEAYSSQNGLLYYFPSYYGVFHGEVFSASARSGFSSWEEAQAFPWLPFGSYWGRALVYRSHVYFSGPFDTAYVLMSKIGKNGALGPWLKTTPMPARYHRRSLHQAVAYRGRFYVIGGWCDEWAPGYTDLLMATIHRDGTLGEFRQIGALPVQEISNYWYGHSAAVSESGNLYLVPNRGGTIWRARIRHNGTVGLYAMQNQTDIAGDINYGGNSILVTSKSQLVVVDFTDTCIFNLYKNGNIKSLAAKVPNPETFFNRTVFEADGHVYVATDIRNQHETVDKIYRLSKLPSP